MAGEPWGDETVTIDIPSGPFLVSGLSAEQAASLRDRYPRPSTMSHAYDISIFRAPASDFVPVETAAPQYELDIDGPVIAGIDLMARLDAHRAAIWTYVTDRGYFWSVVENVLRPLVARRLLSSGGLLVHSSSVVMDGRAFLFCGPSGAGKSTICGLAIKAGKQTFSDDLNAIVEGCVVPLPFTGTQRIAKLYDEPVPLHAIVGLEKSRSEAIRPMSPSQGVSLIVRCAPYVNNDRDFGDALLDRAYELTRAARTGVLTFKLDGDVWPILESW